MISPALNDAHDSSRVSFACGTGTGIGATGLTPMSGAAPMRRVNRTEGHDFPRMLISSPRPAG